MRSLLLAVLLALPLPALAQWTRVTHDTGVVRFEIFDIGKLGDVVGGACDYFGEGFIFEGERGLYEATFLVGASFDQVSGEPWDCGELGWSPVAPITAISPPSGYDQAYETTYDDSASPNPIGLAVTQTTYSRTGDPFAIVDFHIENTSGGRLDGLYVGIFADWDVGFAYNQNLCDYSEDAQVLYCWDSTGTNPNYYGVAALDPPDEDHDVTGIAYDALPGDFILYVALTTIQPTPSSHGADRRTVIGIGPFDVAAGETQRTLFAFVGGASEAEIIANAEAAQPPFVANEPDATSEAAALHAASPNPARGATTLSFTLDRPMLVRLAVLDALGREVAMLADGERVAGEHAVTWEAVGLPAGVYLVRLAAGGALLTERVTISR